jgi:hypothetical protein
LNAIVDERLRLQALACGLMGSPFTQRLLEEAREEYAGGGALAELLDANVRYKRIGLHLCNAVHYLALTGEPTLKKHYPSVGGDGDAVAAWRAASEIVRHEPARFAQPFARIPQTNEVARAMPLLAAYLYVADRAHMPLRLREIGASAGLNLRFDRFGYDGGNWTWGDLASPLVLRNSVASGVPANLNAQLRIADRRGCDLHPLDMAKEEDRIALQSFVWADQHDRFERLRCALEAIGGDPAPLDADDLYAWLERTAQPQRGAATVVAHSVVEEHLNEADRNRLARLVRTLGEHATDDAPLAWVRMEQMEGTYPTEVRMWPGDGRCVTICTSSGHAQAIAWTGA